MKELNEFPVVYAAKYGDKERMRSQSGGLFAAISDVVLENGGTVYGCLFNEKFEAVHGRAATKEERDFMRYDYSGAAAPPVRTLRAACPDVRSHHGFNSYRASLGSNP